MSDQSASKTPMTVRQSRPRRCGFSSSSPTASPELRAFGGDLAGTPTAETVQAMARGRRRRAGPGPAVQTFARSDRNGDQGTRLPALAHEQKDLRIKPKAAGRTETRWLLMQKEYSAMTDSIHKFKVGQTVDLIPSTSRSAARGPTKSSACGRRRAATIRSIGSRARAKSHERVVSESDLVSSANPKFDSD